MILKYTLIIGLISRVCSGNLFNFGSPFIPYYYPIPTNDGFRTAAGNNVDGFHEQTPPADNVRDRAEGPDDARPWYGGAPAGFGPRAASVYPYASPRQWDVLRARKRPGSEWENEEGLFEKKREEVKRRLERLEQRKRDEVDKIRRKVKQRDKMLQRTYYYLTLHHEHDADNERRAPGTGSDEKLKSKHSVELKSNIT